MQSRAKALRKDISGSNSAELKDIIAGFTFYKNGTYNPSAADDNSSDTSSDTTEET